MKPRSRSALALVASVAFSLLSSVANATADAPWPPPSPYSILGTSANAPPAIDVEAPCAGDRTLGRHQLTAILRAGGSADSMACAALELARQELGEGFVAEARASAARALRAFGDAVVPPPLQRAADFYQAESFYRSGEIERAEEMYARLAQGSGYDEPAVRAARLRLADIRYTRSGEDRELRDALRWLEQALARGEDVAQWAPRVAEWTIATDAALTLSWLETVSADLDEAAAAAVAIRKADALYQRKRRAEGQRLLREIADGGRTRAIRQLATVRIIDLEARRGDHALRQLSRTADNGRGELRTYALGVLARRHLAEKRPGDALDALVLAVHGGDSETLVPDRMAAFDSALAPFSTREDCDSIIAALSGRRDILMRHASEPGAFLRLGDCHLELGMAAAALDTYRGVAKAFGPGIVAQVTLRTARAEFSIGRIASARAAARSSVARGTQPSNGWRTLYAEILLEDGRPGRAIEVLTPVVLQIAGQRDAGREGSYALLLSARATLRYDAPDEIRERLRTALALSKGSPETVAWLAEAALIVADLHRLAGEADAAKDLYGPAYLSLDPGPLRSRAGYWHGVYADDIDRAREIWAKVAEGNDPWARLAANETELSKGRAAIGWRTATPKSRTTVKPPQGENP